MPNPFEEYENRDRNLLEDARGGIMGLVGKNMLQDPSDYATAQFVADHKAKEIAKMDRSLEEKRWNDYQDMLKAHNEYMTNKYGDNWGYDEAWIERMDPNARKAQIRAMSDDEVQRWEDEKNGNIGVGDYRKYNYIDPSWAKLDDALMGTMFGIDSEDYEDWSSQKSIGETVAELGLNFVPGLGIAIDARDVAHGHIPGLVDILPYGATFKAAKVAMDAAKTAKKAGTLKNLKRNLKAAKAWDRAGSAPSDNYFISPKWIKESNIIHPEDLQ